MADEAVVRIVLEGEKAKSPTPEQPSRASTELNAQMKGIAKEIAPTKPESPHQFPPPLDPETVRFYHGGVPYNKDESRDVTQYKEYAEGYANKAGEGKILQYIDLLKSDEILKGKKAYEDEGTDQESPYVNFTLPPEYAKKLKPYSITPPQSSSGPPKGEDDFTRHRREEFERVLVAEPPRPPEPEKPFEPQPEEPEISERERLEQEIAKREAVGAEEGSPMAKKLAALKEQLQQLLSSTKPEIEAPPSIDEDSPAIASAKKAMERDRQRRESREARLELDPNFRKQEEDKEQARYDREDRKRDRDDERAWRERERREKQRQRDEDRRQREEEAEEKREEAERRRKERQQEKDEDTADRLERRDAKRDAEENERKRRQQEKDEDYADKQEKRDRQEEEKRRHSNTKAVAGFDTQEESHEKSRFGGMIDTAKSMRGLLGGVGGPLVGGGLDVLANSASAASGAISSIVPVAGAVILAFKAFEAAVDAIDQRVERLAEYSPEISQAQAEREVIRVLNDIRRAQENSAQLAEYIQAQTEMQERWEELKMNILMKVAPIITGIFNVLNWILGSVTEINDRNDVNDIDPTNLILSGPNVPSTGEAAPLIQAPLV